MADRESSCHIGEEAQLRLRFQALALCLGNMRMRAEDTGRETRVLAFRFLTDQNGKRITIAILLR